MATLPNIIAANAAWASCTREFVHCDLSLVVNVKRTCAQLAARFPRVNFLFLAAGAISLKGFDPTPEEGIDRQMASP